MKDAPGQYLKVNFNWRYSWYVCLNDFSLKKYIADGQVCHDSKGNT